MPLKFDYEQVGQNHDPTFHIAGPSSHLQAYSEEFLGSVHVLIDIELQPGHPVHHIIGADLVLGHGVSVLQS